MEVIAGVDLEYGSFNDCFRKFGDFLFSLNVHFLMEITFFLGK